MKQMIHILSSGCLGLLLLALTGCGNDYQEKVVGTWNTNMPLNPKIILNKGGSGSMSISVAGQNVTKNMTWRLNGSNLIFNVDGKDMGGIIKSIDENKMTMYDPAAKQAGDFTFTRVKG